VRKVEVAHKVVLVHKEPKAQLAHKVRKVHKVHKVE
jgi:hypothetical protein